VLSGRRPRPIEKAWLRQQDVRPRRVAAFADKPFRRRNFIESAAKMNRRRAAASGVLPRYGATQRFHTLLLHIANNFSAHREISAL
jgi:hypothetical protein